MYLYHYYEKKTGAFNNLSELPLEKAEKIQSSLQGVFASQRDINYLQRRKYLEEKVRKMFIEKGGRPIRKTPYYLVIEECPWLMTWYKEPEFIKISIEEFDLSAVSFTYGDMFPTFSDRITDNFEYRKQVYTYNEILTVIDKYGLPQHKWDQSFFGQPAYVEVQVWCDNPIMKYR